MKLLLLINCPKSQYPKLKTVLEMTVLRLILDDNELWLEHSRILTPSFSYENTDLISEIWKRARNLILVINGAAKLAMQNWVPITMKNMQWEDDSGNRDWFPINTSVRIFSGSAKVRIEMKSEINSQDGTNIEAKRYHVSALYLAAAGCDESAAKILRLVNREMDWTNLYRILEIISEDVGGYEAIEMQGWTSEDRIKAFTGSANNSSVSGDDSRHGNIQSGQPKQTMDLREARHFIDQVLRKWLSTKVSDVI